MEARFGEYSLTDDAARVDVEAVWELLRGTYWAENRTRDQVEKSVRNSLCFSVHRGARQVAIARVLTDGAASSYVCDVVVDPAHRGKGIGKWLMRCILAHSAVCGTRALLVTRDAQKFYRELGFVTHPFECMVKAEPGE